MGELMYLSEAVAAEISDLVSFLLVPFWSATGCNLKENLGLKPNVGNDTGVLTFKPEEEPSLYKLETDTATVKMIPKWVNKL